MNVTAELRRGNSSQASAHIMATEIGQRCEKLDKVFTSWEGWTYQVAESWDLERGQTPTTRIPGREAALDPCKMCP